MCTGSPSFLASLSLLPSSHLPLHTPSFSFLPGPPLERVPARVCCSRCHGQLWLGSPLLLIYLPLNVACVDVCVWGAIFVAVCVSLFFSPFDCWSVCISLQGAVVSGDGDDDEVDINAVLSCKQGNKSVRIRRATSSAV